MSESYENKLSEGHENANTEGRLKIPMLKYFWQASPLAVNRSNSIHNFLKRINILKNFTDHEIWTLTKYMHMRNFTAREVIFKEGDMGLGFYIIFDGRVEIYSKSGEELDDQSSSQKMARVAELNKYDYLGELAIIDSLRRRNATAITPESASLLAIFKPDLDEMIENHPIVASKFLQSIAIIISNRFYAVTSELKLSKEKIERLEKVNATNA